MCWQVDDDTAAFGMRRPKVLPESLLVGDELDAAMVNCNNYLTELIKKMNGCKSLTRPQCDPKASKTRDCAFDH